MKIRKISLVAVAAGVLLCCELAIASSESIHQIRDDSGIQGFISRVTSVSPEMGRLAEDINNASKVRCGHPLNVQQAENVVKGSSEYVALLQELMSDETYTESGEYQNRIKGIASDTCSAQYQPYHRR